jgi:hypothetical protein
MHDGLTDVENLDVMARESAGDLCREAGMIVTGELEQDDLTRISSSHVASTI